MEEFMIKLANDYIKTQCERMEEKAEEYKTEYFEDVNGSRIDAHVIITLYGEIKRVFN